MLYYIYVIRPKGLFFKDHQLSALDYSEHIRNQRKNYSKIEAVWRSAIAYTAVLFKTNIVANRVFQVINHIAQTNELIGDKLNWKIAFILAKQDNLPKLFNHIQSAPSIEQRLGRKKQVSKENNDHWEWSVAVRDRILKRFGHSFITQIVQHVSAKHYNSDESKGDISLEMLSDCGVMDVKLKQRTIADDQLFPNADIPSIGPLVDDKEEQSSKNLELIFQCGFKSELAIEHAEYEDDDHEQRESEEGPKEKLIKDRGKQFL